MAAPVYATNLTDISLAEATTNFSAIGQGGALAQETDFLIQGTYCVSKATGAQWRNSVLGGAVYNNGSGITIPTDGAIMLWMYWWGPGVLDTKAGGGVEIDVGNLTTAYKGFFVTGSDDWQFGGWRCYPVDPSLTADRTQGVPSGVWQYMGWQAKVVAAAAIAKGNPYGIDAIRYGRCDIICTEGEAADYATFLGAAAYDNASSRRWGLLIPRDGAYYQQGLFQIGSAGTAADFRDANRSIFIQNTEKVTSGFNKFEILHASTRVDWTSISFVALGTVSKGNLEVVNNADVNIEGCSFTDMGTFAFLSNSTILDSTFRRTGQITAGGATFTGCTIAASPATSAVLAASPAGAALITETTFSSAGTGHGLEIAGTAANITLTEIEWVGYAVSDGSTGNEAIYVNIASGSMNLTIDGGTIPSVRTAGCVVTVVAGAVTVSATAVTTAGTPIESAKVFVKATSGGPMPVDASVTIVNSGTTATVTHTAHGLASNDLIWIRGASHDENNGVFTISRINDNSYSYTMDAAPGSDPIGTITATFVLLKGLTNASGIISMSRVFSSNQPVAGWARKASASPYYKTGTMVGTVDSNAGLSLGAVLIAD